VRQCSFEWFGRCGAKGLRSSSLRDASRGQDGQALGRSRGGFSTKIHLKTDHDGLPIAFDLTPGQASDSRHLPVVLDLGPDITPRVSVDDKG
jgi:hypothetical protein